MKDSMKAYTYEEKWLVTVWHPCLETTNPLSSFKVEWVQPSLILLPIVIQHFYILACIWFLGLDELFVSCSLPFVTFFALFLFWNASFSSY